ncbi:MAG TPA: ankyrin repeat domain-containing protein [Cyclobacteriaceae bacterium]|nr:ankyrin repeat domain-containing protein [Cyclobacteriaceae bacterium]
MRNLIVIFLFLFPPQSLYFPAQDNAKTDKLFRAAKKGDKEAIRKLAVNGDIKSFKKLFIKGFLKPDSEEAAVALEGASYWGELGLIKFLLDQGVDPNGDKKHHIPLISASSNGPGGNFWADTGPEEGWPEAAALLLDHGADIHIRDIFGETALQIAARKGFMKVTLLLLKRGADFNARFEDGRPIAWQLVSYGNFEGLKFVLERGYDIYQATWNGETMLLEASQKGQASIVDLLLDHSIPIKPSKNNYTLITEAAYRGHIDVVQVLLEHGEDINVSESNGETALLSAVRGSRVETVIYLLEHGANANIQNNEGITPLLLAERNKEYAGEEAERIIELLIQYGAENH